MRGEAARPPSRSPRWPPGSCRKVIPRARLCCRKELLLLSRVKRRRGKLGSASLSSTDGGKAHAKAPPKGKLGAAAEVKIPIAKDTSVTPMSRTRQIHFTAQSQGAVSRHGQTDLGVSRLRHSEAPFGLKLAILFPESNAGHAEPTDGRLLLPRVCAGASYVIGGFSNVRAT